MDKESIAQSNEYSTLPTSQPSPVLDHSSLFLSSNKIKLIMIGLGVLGGILYISSSQLKNLQPTKTEVNILPTSVVMSPKILPTAPRNDQNNVTAGWESYANAEVQLSFKYPKDWLVVTNCKFGSICFSTANYKEKLDDRGDGGGSFFIDKGSLFSISTSLRKESINLDNFCQPGGPVVIKTCEDIQISHLRAKKWIVESADKVERETKIAILNEKYLIIVGQSYSSPVEKKILDQILSTLEIAP
jgi:hypothetical protein